MSKKEPTRETACPDCGKKMVNANAVRMHRAWKHAPGASDAAPASKPTPKAQPVATSGTPTPKRDWLDELDS